MRRRHERGLFLGGLGGAAIVPLLGRAASADTYTLRMNVAQNVGTPMGQTALRLASAVERQSNGRLKIEVFPNFQLGKEQAIVDGLVTGVVDLTIQSSAQLVPLVPALAIFDTPFVFKDLATGFRVMDGPLGTEFFSMLDAKGILGLGWGTVGFREIETTNRAIVVPDDMKGLRMRIQSGAVYVATYQALGAIPVTIDYSEAFMALTQHTVDGIDINIVGVATEKYYTVVKHVALAHLILSTTPMFASKRKIEALPPDLQKILRDAAKSVVPAWRTSTIAQTAESIDFLKKNGVAFTQPPYAAFRKAVEPVYAIVQARIGGDMLERVTRAANAA